jgi:hypothetical protein
MEEGGGRREEGGGRREEGGGRREEGGEERKEIKGDLIYLQLILMLRFMDDTVAAVAWANGFYVISTIIAYLYVRRREVKHGEGEGRRIII